MTGPLEGVRVVDFSQLYQGPLATQMLADLGADIVKVEPPRGDFFRTWSLGDRFPAGESLSFLAVNRNKRSIVIDLKRPGGRDVALQLIDRADVLVENFRPGVMDRLGLGSAEVVTRNPRLVYCASSGYGPDGPYSDLPGQDLLVQAIAGTMWLTGRRDDPPTAVGYGIADAAAGLHIVIGVLAGLLERGRNGYGQRIDINLLSSLVVLQSHEFSYYLNTGEPPVRPRSNTTAAYTGAPLGIYETRAGYLALAMMPIGRLAAVIGATDLVSIDSSNEIENRDEIHARLEAVFRTRPREEWLALLRASDIWCAPVQSLGEAADDPQVRWNGMVAEVEHPTVGSVQVVGRSVAFGRTPLSVLTAPPLLGQHTIEILEEVGYDGPAIQALLGEGVVVQGGNVERSDVPVVGDGSSGSAITGRRAALTETTEAPPGSIRS
jgi:crotonobetainyl-CoA:carnitine CoA-transferase CaiB-like acyl-CoA transferase